MIEAILPGLTATLTPQAVLFILIGCAYGLVVGILPGACAARARHASGPHRRQAVAGLLP